MWHDRAWRRCYVSDWLIKFIDCIKVHANKVSQGSAWHCYIGRRLSKGNCIFWPLGLEKPMIIFEPNLAGVTTSVRSTNSLNLVQIGCEMAPPRVVKCNGFVTFFSNLFSFFSVSSANPLVAILVRFARLMFQKMWSDWSTCLFRVWCLHIHLKGSLVQKTAKFGPVKVGTLLFLAKNRFYIRTPRVNYPGMSRYPIKVTFLIENYRNSFLVMVVQPEEYLARWRLLLSLIS